MHLQMQTERKAKGKRRGLLCVRILHDPHPAQAKVKVEGSENTKSKLSIDPKVDSTPGQLTCNWRDDRLVGRCFGLTCATGRPPEGTKANGTKIAAARISEDYRFLQAWADTAASCEELCCRMGPERCISYQFRGDVGCCLGPAVRLGLEKAASPHWCEPTPPKVWSGRELARRTPGTGGTKAICEWGSESLEGQCFGLGKQYRGSANESASGDALIRSESEGWMLNEMECATACCQDASCGMWQWRGDKGCFYTDKKGHCESLKGKYEKEAFTGKRRVVPNDLLSNGWLKQGAGI
ncbi:hypothetical protein CYMTET_3363 [Cymbomonas tetramitiformis]|uniref:Uncharacterized protein n=1 Tax=Cymbomonas tetramitiformis TaxID=36881 RepID=A0AAE0LL64_9CHLO|nr:hypothetical protein CYMTET_3363 [Cymbomonas tetramitiformis]